MKEDEVSWGLGLSRAWAVTTAKVRIRSSRALRLALILVIALLSSSALSSGAGAVAATGDGNGPESTTLRAEATNTTPQFRKFIFSWTVPRGVYFGGVSGELAAKSSKASFSEALFTLHDLPVGTCPKTGEIFNSYTDIRNKYPGSRQLMARIIKSNAAGTVSKPISLVVPDGVALSQCVFLILDGSIKTGGAYTMAAQLQLDFKRLSSAESALEPRPMGDEYCLGMARGCGPYHTQAPDQTFTDFMPAFSASTEIVSLVGNDAVSAFTHDIGAFYAAPIPTGEWKVQNDFYVVPHCQPPSGGQVEGNHIPPGSVRFASIATNGKRADAGDSPIALSFKGIVAPAGGCVAHVVQKTMGDGALDAELQTVVYTRPALVGAAQ